MTSVLVRSPSTTSSTPPLAYASRQMPRSAPSYLPVDPTPPGNETLLGRPARSALQLSTSAGLRSLPGRVIDPDNVTAQQTKHGFGRYIWSRIWSLVAFSCDSATNGANGGAAIQTRRPGRSAAHIRSPCPSWPNRLWSCRLCPKSSRNRQ